MNLKITSTMMTMMFLLSALAGCTGGDEAVDLDDSDGGYDYASNVDNHRMLMGDVCESRTYPEHTTGTVSRTSMRMESMQRSPTDPTGP